MAHPDPTTAYPLLFAPRRGGEEQRAYFRRRFEEFAAHLTRCREDETYGFAVDDLDVFRGFFDAHCEDRAWVRELVAAGRITAVCFRAPETDDLVQAGLWRRHARAGAECWEGILGGAVNPGSGGEPVPVLNADPALTRALTTAVQALLEAEGLAALASFAHGPCPAAQLDRAWRQVLFAWSCAGAAGGPGDTWYVDVVSACHEAAAVGAGASGLAAHYLSEQVNTAAAKGAAPDGRSLLVLNPSGAAYTGPCVAGCALPESLAAGFELCGPGGRTLPCQVEGLSAGRERPTVQLRFQVAEIPPFGYRTYSLRRAARLPQAAPSDSLDAAPVCAVLAQVHPGPLPPDFSPVRAAGNSISILSVSPCAGPAEDAGGMRLLFRETTGQPQTVVLSFPYEPRAAWRLDTRERQAEELRLPRAGLLRSRRLAVAVGAQETVGLEVHLELPALTPRPTTRTITAPDLEPSDRVFARYWEHNVGAAPLGGLPLGVWAEGTLLPGENTRFPVYLSNDGEEECVGTVELQAPEAWTLIPRRLPYRLPPHSQGLFEAMVIVPEDAPACFLRAETSDGSRLVCDVLPIGPVQPLAATLTRGEDGRMQVHLVNPNAADVEGSITFIAPPARPGILQVHPLTRPFHVRAGGTLDVRFRTGEEEAPGWPVVKVAWYGNVQYVRANG